MNLLTVNQLDEWMSEDCYNKHSYAIGNRNIHEGFGLDKLGELYVWYYTERGNRNNLKYFQTEKEAVEYAFEIIQNDKFANSHMIGFVKSKADENELLTELTNRKVEFWKDEIPYGGLNDMRIRIFVNGCDVLKVSDLQMNTHR